MRINKLPIILALGAIIFTSCSKDSSDDLPKGDYEKGVLISGEGSGGATGSISFISNDFETVENLIYKKVNKAELGTYLQSMAFDDNNNAFIVVDNQNTITVVDRYTFEKRGEITTELSKPRYMTVVGDKAYVTNWGSTSDETDDFIAVVNLKTYTVESKIPVKNGPERIISRDGILYVSHKGAFTTNNIVSVINIDSKNVQEITVKDNPDELFFNIDGNLVVLSSGRTIYNSDWTVTGHTKGSISTINIGSGKVSSELVFADEKHPSLMVVNGNKIYYSLENEIYIIDYKATDLATTSLLSTEGTFYGMEIKGDNIFTLNTSFTDISKLNVYNFNTKKKVYTKKVALGASKIYFN